LHELRREAHELDELTRIKKRREKEKEEEIRREKEKPTN